MVTISQPEGVWRVAWNISSNIEHELRIEIHLRDIGWGGSTRTVTESGSVEEASSVPTAVRARIRPVGGEWSAWETVYAGRGEGV